MSRAARSEILEVTARQVEDLAMLPPMGGARPGANGRPPTLYARSPELVREVLVERAGEFVAQPHPYTSLAPHLSDAGRRLLRLTGGGEASDPQLPARLEEFVSAAAEEAAERLSRLAGPSDLLPTLHGLALRNAAHALFGMDPQTDWVDVGRSCLAWEVDLVEAGMLGGRMTGPAPPPRGAFAALVDELVARLVDRDGTARAPTPRGSPPLDWAVLVTLGNAGIPVGLTLGWLTVLVSQRPELVRSLRDERDDRPPEHGAVPASVRIVREVLRLYPPAFVFTRRAQVDTRLGGREVPQGTNVLISPYHLHRDPRYWSSAEQFDPDRPELVRPRPYTYIPFGAGPKRCAAPDFALREMQITLRSFFRRHDVVLTDGPRIEMATYVSLRPWPGVIGQVAPLAERVHGAPGVTR